jgi:glyoxylase-like metal-dependent hydrolase (beta-lactamase superfamily II)
MSPLDEVVPGLWRVTVARNGVPPTMTAYVLRDGEDTILVDPLVSRETDPLLASLDEVVRGRVRILVTTPFHVRGSGLLWRRWRDRHEVTIFGHEHCATRLDDRSAFRPLRGGESLDGGVRAHAIGKPRRAEIPFELPTHRALAFGDTVSSTGSSACGRGIATSTAPGTRSASSPRWSRSRGSTSSACWSRTASRCCATAPAS